MPPLPPPPGALPPEYECRLSALGDSAWNATCVLAQGECVAAAQAGAAASCRCLPGFASDDGFIVTGRCELHIGEWVGVQALNVTLSSAVLLMMFARWRGQVFITNKVKPGTTGLNRLFRKYIGSDHLRLVSLNLMVGNFSNALAHGLRLWDGKLSWLTQGLMSCSVATFMFMLNELMLLSLRAVPEQDGGTRRVHVPLGRRQERMLKYVSLAHLLIGLGLPLATLAWELDPHRTNETYSVVTMVYTLATLAIGFVQVIAVWALTGALQEAIKSAGDVARELNQLSMAESYRAIGLRIRRIRGVCVLTFLTYTLFVVRGCYCLLYLQETIPHGTTTMAITTLAFPVTGLLVLNLKRQGGSSGRPVSHSGSSGESPRDPEHCSDKMGKNLKHQGTLTAQHERTKHKVTPAAQPPSPPMSSPPPSPLQPSQAAQP